MNIRLQYMQSEEGPAELLLYDIRGVLIKKICKAKSNKGIQTFFARVKKSESEMVAVIQTPNQRIQQKITSINQ